MNDIKIIKNTKYLPEIIVENSEVEKKHNLENGYIEKRTGIKKRNYAKEETIEEMAIKAAKKIFEKGISKENIGLVIVATTSAEQLMPGIANTVQKELKIKPCICLDILAGCSGYINAFDIARMYIKTEKIQRALIIGVEKLSNYTKEEDIGTSILLADGAGATLIEKTDERKKYFSNIQASGENNQILTCKIGQNINMKGKEVYRYAVTQTVENVKELLEKSEEKIENIKYIVPHQSNIKIMRAIASRLKIEEKKMYINIDQIGNTFCASIPIAICEMEEKNMLQPGDKIILLGYGGGLNTGSILLEI